MIGVGSFGGGAAGRRSRWANCARNLNSFFSLLSLSCLMRATMADASLFPSGPITAFGLGGLSGLWESIVVAMVSSSGSFERLDRAGEGPRGSKPRARGFFLFGFSGEGVFASSSTFGAFLKSRAKRPGFGLLATSPSTLTGVAGVLLGERGILVVGCLSRGCLAASYSWAWLRPCVVRASNCDDASSARTGGSQRLDGAANPRADC